MDLLWGRISSLTSGDHWETLWHSFAAWTCLLFEERFGLDQIARGPNFGPESLLPAY